MSRDEILRYFANKYIWWKLPYDVMETSERIVAQAMRYADLDEFVLLWKVKEDMIQALNNAQCGWFDEKSWNFWRLVLDLPKKDLPKRGFMQ